MIVLCSLLVPLAGCGEDLANSARGPVVGIDEAQARSLQFANSALSWFSHANLDQIVLPQYLQSSSSQKMKSFAGMACPHSGLSSQCGNGFVIISTKDCWVPSGSMQSYLEFRLPQIDSEFSGCLDKGINLVGYLKATIRTQVSRICSPTGPTTFCPDSFLWLENLRGELSVRDESGFLWNLQFLSGTFFVRWIPQESKAFRVLERRIENAIILLQGMGGLTYRCVIQGGVVSCGSPDEDGDGVAEDRDNCPGNPNPDQQDLDGDGIGDACDAANLPCNVSPPCSSRRDCEVFRQACENIDAQLTRQGQDLFCPTDVQGAVCKAYYADIVSSECVEGPADPSPRQKFCYVECGSNEDCFYGDICVDGCCRFPEVLEDFDHDGVIELYDNCTGDKDLSLLLPYRYYNSTQGDCDKDGWGDACDNCPLVPNPDQLDTEFPEFAGDGIGDACDPDDDNDGVPDVDDPCPYIPYGSTADVDRDGTPDICDNCIGTANPDQIDQDEDLSGDLCDNCPAIFNRFQNDFDGDNIGDECDPDLDGDLVENSSDNCAYFPNPDQADSDGNGIGDVCDFGPPPSFCGDGFCDPKSGEDVATCPEDCSVVPPSFCGDRFCDPKS
ncbi:hypothetical protein F9K50_04060, partial [bacterium]